MYFCPCYQGYKPPDEGPSEYQTIPLNKIEDFGVHCKQYVKFQIINYLFMFAIRTPFAGEVGTCKFSASKVQYEAQLKTMYVCIVFFKYSN